MTDEQKALAMSYKRLFASDDGVRVLLHLSRFCKERGVTYVDGNSHGTAFNEGARSVILTMRRQIEMNLEEVKPETAQTEEKDNA